jgi:peroxiredoxin Q/BCP
MPIPPTGSPAPDFSLVSDSGSLVRLADLRGRPVVLYFYPKDDTPGCTVEACAFRDDYGVYEKAGAVILGVSPDSVDSHKKFKAKFNLPFPLLADEGHRVAEAYGAWGEKKRGSGTTMGILRTTFLIGRDGVLLKVFEKVRPDGHSQEILAALPPA